MTDSTPTTAPHRVVIAGGGVAGLEALIALHDLAGDRVATTLVSPTGEFTIRALSVQDPFARPSSGSYDVARICADHGARFVQDAVHDVRPAEHRLTTVAGHELE